MDDGDEYESALAPCLDGTNSGVQHYAAASLNKEDGQLVNLVPGDKPQDIYRAVADVVKEDLENSSEDLAKAWLDYGV